MIQDWYKCPACPGGFYKCRDFAPMGEMERFAYEKVPAFITECPTCGNEAHLMFREVLPDPE